MLWEAAPRLVEVIQPWLFRFICHSVVTVFTFLQESPGTFYNIVTRTQSCARSFPRLKISLPQSQRRLHQWGQVLCKPRDGNQGSLIFYPWGALLPFSPVLTGSQPPPTFGNRLTSASGFPMEPCLLLTRPGLREFSDVDFPCSAACFPGPLSFLGLFLSFPPLCQTQLLVHRTRSHKTVGLDWLCRRFRSEGLELQVNVTQS